MSKNVTAPRRWKSSPNSPSTQLAYVTKPEIDLLVKANLHGSMKGKPNKGPKGIMSLDGGGSSYRRPSKPSKTSKNSFPDPEYFFGHFRPINRPNSIMVKIPKTWILADFDKNIGFSQKHQSLTIFHKIIDFDLGMMWG